MELSREDEALALLRLRRVRAAERRRAAAEQGAGGEAFVPLLPATERPRPGSFTPGFNGAMRTLRRKSRRHAAAPDAAAASARTDAKRRRRGSQEAATRAEGASAPNAASSPPEPGGSQLDAQLDAIKLAVVCRGVRPQVRDAVVEAARGAGVACWVVDATPATLGRLAGLGQASCVAGVFASFGNEVDPMTSLVAFVLERLRAGAGSAPS